MSLADNERSLEAMLEVINDPTIADVDARLSAPDRPWRPPSLDDLVTFGKYKDRVWTFRDLARRDASYTKWAAINIGGVKGQLCAEALAELLGVTE
jgi:hypothetical protein